ncbi:MAG: flagellar biosynthesis protein FlgC [Alphaproteobacteria bacterium]|nr:flagellar biosynthesis protein FlgC [Alphaproteobacteria bacterium]
MEQIRSTALTGLAAATRRLAASASNIANQRTTRPVDQDAEAPADVYRPVRVRQTALVPYGVESEFETLESATVVEPDPYSPTGYSAAPDFDYGEEMVQQRIAMLTYKANLAVLSAQGAMEEALLDISA